MSSITSVGTNQPTAVRPSKPHVSTPPPQHAATNVQSANKDAPAPDSSDRKGRNINIKV